MAIILELSPSEEFQLAHVAKFKGVPMNVAAREIVSKHLLMIPKLDSEIENGTTLLFSKWDKEDEKMTPEEIAQANEEWEELKRNLNQTRLLNGEEPLF